MKKLLYSASLIVVIALAVITSRDSSETVLGGVQYKKGTTNEQTVTIPDDAVAMRVSITRAELPEKGAGSNVVRVVTRVWNSQSDWGNACGFTTDGGVRYGESGVATESYNECRLYPGIGRKVMVRIEALEDIRTDVRIDFIREGIVKRFLRTDSAYANFAHLQSSSAGSACGSVTSCAVSYPSNTTAKSLLINTCRYGSNGRTETVTDAQGNSYAKALEREQANDSDGTLMMHYATNTVGGTTNSTTCTIDGAAAIMRATVSEFSYDFTKTPTVETTSWGETTASTQVNAASTTPTNNNSLFFAGIFTSGTVTHTASSPFTQRSAVPGGISTRLSTQSYIQTIAAEQGSVTTFDAASNNLLMFATFYELSPPAGPVNRIIINNGSVIINGGTIDI